MTTATFLNFEEIMLDTGQDRGSEVEEVTAQEALLS
jgi:hypothetical protein